MISTLRSEIHRLRARLYPSDEAEKSTQANRGALECPICPDPDPDCPCQVPQAGPPTSFTSALPLLGRVPQACGLCRFEEECICRSIQVDSEPAIPRHNENNGIAMPDQTKPSPPLPIRLPPRSSAAPIWSINNSEEGCTGDPTNCEACRDNSFGTSQPPPSVSNLTFVVGQEFCSNLAVPKRFVPCADCPGNCMSIKSLLCLPEASPSSPSIPRIPRPEMTGMVAGTMRTDEAWRSLKVSAVAEYGLWNRHTPIRNSLLWRYWRMSSLDGRDSSRIIMRTQLRRGRGG